MRVYDLHPPVCCNQTIRLRRTCRIPNLSKVSASVQPPPADYDFRADSQESTHAYVAEHYPSLSDLVEEGSLVAIQRPALYVERRTDGYQEPESVLILGTAHLSQKSARDAVRVIEAVRPQNVVVELCKSRAGVMYEDAGSGAASKGDFQASGGSFQEVVQRMLQLGGVPALMLRLLLARATKGLGSQMGLQTGGEFRAARIAAEESGAQLVLGDRPIEVSLRRAWQALGWRRRLQLLSGLAQAAVLKPDFDAAVIEEMKSDTAVSAMLREFSARFPEVMPALIHERDVYIAWSLTRSKAVNGSKVVVGIIGRGHLGGVVYAMTHSHGNLRFRDLAGTRPQKGDMQLRLARRLAFEIALLLATVWGWRALTGSGC